jgi:signal peptidase I
MDIMACRYGEDFTGRRHPLAYGETAERDGVEISLVPAGHVFAMGDNRDNSLDSRVQSAVGFVPIDNLVGRAEFIFFSVDGSSPIWQVWIWPCASRWSRRLSPVR